MELIWQPQEDPENFFSETISLFRMNKDIKRERTSDK
jgi:hypothetical protein